MKTKEELRKYKTDWARNKYQSDPEYRKRWKEKEKARRLYKREWLEKKRQTDPVFREAERKKALAWKKENPDRIGVRARKKVVYTDSYEEQAPGHCRVCGIKLKARAGRVCEDPRCKRSWSSGMTAAFQAVSEGSIPSGRTYEVQA